MEESSQTDIRWMRRALDLAARARGRTSPNPMVGAVLVKDGEIVGEGFHAYAGSDHAEVVALHEAEGAAAGATLYVSLEPCCHQGRTPPCVEQIVGAGVRHVVAACEDPNPAVSGKGIAALRAAGVLVDVGVLAEEAIQLNEAFFTYIRTGRPFVILKAAASLDGKIATRTGESRWITGEAARHRVHQLRNEVDAVLVGIGTVLRDDPLLNTRLGIPDQRDPARVIVDNLARLPLRAKVVNRASTAPTLLAVSQTAPRARLEALEREGIQVIVVDGSPRRVSLGPLMDALGKLGFLSVMIEGGAEINASALREGVVNKVLLFLAPILIGGKSAPTAVGGEGIESLGQATRLQDVRIERFDDDILVEGYIRKQTAGS
ncbi:MAG TPA: bifunctional diaminohydroxyphosphoribosylaminopyrimidine deaminase/5-amino-6-(5-phosphoribosylamino)uracil reductase RibD [Candidatus Methylomirabilis sp.]|nr:bifunctional diaminohydroxyphosphoribosylaminopyrimidine deaminase/5-amino-6-(5-phosphoribosylamino)uracil reductase RibD [Candidatus Methylomirabilis sp.]